MKMLADASDSPEPDYNGYQLVGDSQFLRFSESLLNLKRKEKNGVFHIGFCVSGQRISDLLRRVQVGFADVSEKVVLMIGTNDLLRGTSFEAMRKDLDELLKLLCKDAEKIIVLTIPPVLKLKNDKDHWNRLKKYNHYIKQCGDDERIFVGDAYAKFIVPKKLPSRKLTSRRANLAKLCRSRESSPPLQLKMNSPKCSSSSASTRISLPRKDLSCQPRSHRALSLSPSERRVPQQYSVVSKSDRPERRTRPAKRPTDGLLFSRRVIGDIIGLKRKHDPESNSNPSLSPPTPSSGNDDSFQGSQQLTPKKKKCKSYLCPTTSVSNFDSFISPGNADTSAEKLNSYPLSPTPSSGSEDSFETRPGTVLTSNRKCNSSTTRRARTPERICNSSFLVRTSCSGDDDSCVTPSKRTPKKRAKSQSPSRADDKPNDSYGRGSTGDEVDIENADKIREDCFEPYFGADTRRPDRIHLNTKGLCALKGVIQCIMDVIKEHSS